MKIAIGFITLLVSSSLIGGDIPIFVAPGDQVAPSVAFSGNNYLVVWEDRREGYGINGQLVSEEGTLIGDNFYISTGGRFPLVEWGEENYLVAWNFSGQLVSEDGTPIGDNFCIFTGNDTLSFSYGIGGIAWNGENYLAVVPGTIRAPSLRYCIFARFVSSNGTLGDSLILVAGGDSLSGPAFPRVASDGKDFLVVWEKGIRQGPHQIWGRCVSDAGAGLDTCFQISSYPPFEWMMSPDVAWGGENYLVIWNDGRGGGGCEWDIYGQLISKEGILVGEEIPICTAPGGNMQFPRVASNGMNYLAVWFDSRTPPPWKIYGQFVSFDGTSTDTNFMVSEDPPSDGAGQWEPDICGGGGRYFIVWSEQGWQLPDSSLDIYGNFIPFTGIETDNTLPLSDMYLFQNKPNPFKNTENTEVSYFLPKNSEVTFTIFNLEGQVVFRKNLGRKSVGFHTLTIDGDKLGSQGVYFYRIETDGHAIIRKLVMIGK